MSDEKTSVEKAPKSETPKTDSSCCSEKMALLFASILCRLWLGVRAVQSGIEKFSGSKAVNETVKIAGEENEYGLTAGSSTKAYSLDFYHGVPETLLPKFQDQPLMPSFALKLFDMVLGPALIFIGLTLLLGFCTRISYLAHGLIYIGLTWGMILLGAPWDSTGSAQLATHIILIVAGLCLIKHDRLTLPILKKW
ncbi:MAG: hypothetical protein R3242_10115 [Akkermansiaceae bacterium]|nr:hypothetical protein [Akkermansiaceae bacterium]